MNNYNYNEEIRQKLIKQGKLVDEWGRKIEPKKDTLVKSKSNLKDILSILFIICYAIALVERRQEEIIYCIKWIFSLINK